MPEPVNVKAEPMAPEVGGYRGDPSASFHALAERWHRETGMFSSIAKKLRHPAYQGILSMGDVAVPLILAELASRPGHWFEALKSLTGEDPVPEGDRADVRKAATAWLAWGRRKGLVP